MRRAAPTLAATAFLIAIALTGCLGRSAEVRVVNDLDVTLTLVAFCSNEECTRFHKTYGPFPPGEAKGRFRQTYGIPHRYLFEEPDGTRRCLVLDYRSFEEVPFKPLRVSEMPLCPPH